LAPHHARFFGSAVCVFDPELSFEVLVLVDIGDDDSNLDFFGSSELFANYVTFLGDCLEKAGRIVGCPLDCVSVPSPGLRRSSESALRSSSQSWGASGDISCKQC